MGHEGKLLVLFDGVCNLCDAFVLFLIDRDPKARLMFAPLSSDLGQALLQKHGLLAPGFDSVVLVDGEHAYSQSSAILRILTSLPGPWKLCWLGLIVPRFLRDMAYRALAKRRYAWFGKRDMCRIPTPELRARFVENAL